MVRTIPFTTVAWVPFLILASHNNWIVVASCPYLKDFSPGHLIFSLPKKKQSRKYGFDKQEVDKELLYVYLINVFAFNFDKL